MSWLRGDYVVLHPDDVAVIRSEAGEVLGYRVARSLLSEHPLPWQPSITKERGYQGSGDPGRPTQLMQPQTRSVHPAPGSLPKLPQSAFNMENGKRNERTQ